MIKFLENIGDFYSQNFFSEDFPKKVFDKAGYVTQKKKDDEKEYNPNHISEINAKVNPLREQYYQFKKDLLNLQREKDKVKRTHDFHKKVLDVLGYSNGQQEYGNQVYLNDKEIIPVLFSYTKGNKPFLYIMEMKGIVKESDDKEPEGIYEQIWGKDDWEKVYPEVWKDIELKPDVVKDALSELFLLPVDERPEYVIMLAGAKIFLINYEKWKYDSYLLFDIEQLVEESRIPANRDYLSLFYALLNKSQFISDTESLLQSLDEDAHKAAYGVTQDLKEGVVYAVETLANEAIYYKLNQAETPQEKEALKKKMANETFANELKDDCLTMVYRLLFLFYAESREELEILPIKDHTYQKGYSLEMLRDMEMIELRTESSRNGHFISKSLWKLFNFLFTGKQNGHKGFAMKRLDSPLFDNNELTYLKDVHFRNFKLQSIIFRLSLSKGNRRNRPGRISYANLGINQLGSVYESLLAYRGFFASEAMIEVKAANDATGKDGTFVVPFSRRDDFKDDEVLKDPENPDIDKEIPEGHFVYRLNGRDRKKSASFYTPEVLTRTTVKYTLKGIIDRLKERQENGEFCADEILELKILEPAMGAAAFQNEAINQLAVAYLELKENEEVRKERKRIVPGRYHDELQKVKAYIAAKNVYGVDINPTAIELGKLSLWLNCMHKGMETPFFANRLGVGNAVVGCWLKVYNRKDVIVEYPIEGTKRLRETPISKTWWANAPHKIAWDKKGNITRKPGQFYHFLLPDDNMLASANIKLLKEELTKGQIGGIKDWKKEFKQPLSTLECNRLEKICKVIDTLLQEHYNQIKGIIKDTTSAYAIYGQEPPQMALKGYNEKERLKETLEARNAPYYKLRMVMDYWCSLWFWDARNVADLPTRTQWYNEVENILGVDLSFMDENATPRDILTQISQKAGDTWTLFADNTRISIVEKLRNQHRFFHHELEFLEVFKERGGFDVIVGNPPWVKIEFEGKLIQGDVFPELIIRNVSAPKARVLDEVFFQNLQLKEQYLKDYIETQSMASFMNAMQNFEILKGHQPDLYKNILVVNTEIKSPGGFIGLVHPPSIYDDAKGTEFRGFLYNHIEYLFHFRNEFKLFKETNDKGRLVFLVCIYSSEKKAIDFKLISNLFHPSTIDGCLNGNANGPQNIKIKNENGKPFWNTAANSRRVVNMNNEFMQMLSEAQGVKKAPKMAYLHSEDLKKVFSTLSKYSNHKVKNCKVYFSLGFHETNDIGLYIDDINHNTQQANVDNYEFVYNGPHFTILNPTAQSPKTVYNSNNDYQSVNFELIDENFFPNSKYLPKYDGLFNPELEKFGKNWYDCYRWATRAMVGSNSERTFQNCIIPPKAIHIHGVLSLLFEHEKDLISFSGISSSIVLDFYVKTNGWSNIQPNSVYILPASLPEKYNNELFGRVLVSNCVNKYFGDLWKRNWNAYFKTIHWSKDDTRLKLWSSLQDNWSWNTPLRNHYERRQALIEIDVIISMALGLTLEDLILMYEVQFSVLQQNEEDTYFDAEGKIVFTSSRSLSGTGVPRGTWDEIKEMKFGEKYKYVIDPARNELQAGKELTYIAPFVLCDRIEDYKTAWAHFEKIFAEENTQ
ncbi:hypothetical protein QA597_10535 [Marinilabiliaceae bacterium ANBcel2]|nr:hypothetical protein [Marinilabiliaceae bacterium ANBcel2]